jgi:hypothetical protein
MRWIWTFIVVLALYGVDRAYLDGENAALVSSVLRSAGSSINGHVDDMLRPLRR